MKYFLLWGESLLSGMLPFVLLMTAGIYLTFKTRAAQLRSIGRALKFCLKPVSGKKGISSFGAACNSLAATVGTGNIAGVAAAISTGGAGAVFWMWISALVSMSLKGAEITLSVLYRKKQKGGFVGGPTYYMKEGLGCRVFPFCFAVAGVFSAFTTGNVTQVNSFSSVLGESLILRLLLGAFFALCVGFIIKGGAPKITRFTTAALPFMTLAYIVFCLGVILKNVTLLDDAIKAVFKGAFSPSAVTGGAVGSLYKTIITGAQKGVFSNESGMGTAGMAHATAEDASPRTQWLYGIFEVFVDTILICTLTALTILCSGVIIDYGSAASSELVGYALSALYGKLSYLFLAVMLGFFAISSVVGWAAYGINFSGYLLGKNGEKLFVTIYPLFCVLGVVAKVDVAWRWAEFFNGIMLIINVLSVLGLSKKALAMMEGENNDFKNKRLTKKFRKR